MQAAETGGYQDGPGDQARFDYVTGAAVVGNDLYLSDSGNGVIRRINLGTGQASTLAGAQRQFGTTDGSFTEARFLKPGPMVAAGSTLYVIEQATEHGGACIRSLDLTAQRVSTVTGDCKRKGNLDGPRETALFASPRALAVSGGTLYVGDYARVRAVALPGGAVTTLVGEADADCNFGLQRICKGGFTDGVGNEARLTGVRSMALIGRTLYVADGDAIRGLDLDSRRLTTLIGAAQSRGSKDGIGAQAELLSVGAMLPSSGGLFLLQTNTFAGLRYLNLATKAVASLTGMSLPPFVRGASNVDGLAAKADIKSPRLLAQHGDRILIIQEHGRVRVFERH